MSADDGEEEKEKDQLPQGNEWEVPYFCLVCLEKLNENFHHLVSSQLDLWTIVVKCLVHPHSWVKQASSRMVSTHLSSLDPSSFCNSKPSDEKSGSSFLAQIPGSLYEVGRNLCFQLNTEESQQVEAISTFAIKSLTWVIQAMHHHPELCFKEEDGALKSESLLSDDPTIPESTNNKNPVSWLVTRLSNMARNRGEIRRQVVFKCFAAFCTSCDSTIICPYLELMIEPLNRCIVEATSKTENNPFKKKRVVEDESITSVLAKDVLQVLEDQCGTDEFLRAYSTVRVNAREKRERRKQEIAAEAVRDPQAAAVRKIKKNEHEKRRRKRKVDERRKARGSIGKKRYRYD